MIVKGLVSRRYKTAKIEQGATRATLDSILPNFNRTYWMGLENSSGEVNFSLRTNNPQAIYQELSNSGLVLKESEILTKVK